MRRLLPLILGLAFAGSGLFVAARADVIYLESGGQHRGTIVKETTRNVTIKTAGGEITVPRYEISRIVKEEKAKDYVKRRLKELHGSQDPDAYYELGVWAADHDLPKGAEYCWKKAIAIDAYHRPSREKLGHVYHQGRWYTPEDYKRVVEGLVQWEGRWVTPEEKALLEQGYVQDDNGHWVDPQTAAGAADDPQPSSSDGGFRREREAKPKPAAAERPKPSRKKAGAEPPPENLDWYRDNTAVCDFNSAPTLESRYYQIKTNIKPEYADRYGKMMDQYYIRFIKVFHNYLPNGDLPKSTIWIYAHRNAFMAATGMGQGVGGFYSTGNKRVTAYHGLFGQTGTTRTVLSHEGTHQFEDIILQGSFGNCPIWILEGLAVFFESAYYDGDQVIIGLVPHDRLAALKRGLETNSLIPLSDLIRTPQPQFTGYHYAHAWGLIYMILYYGESKSIQKRCQQWFADLMMDSRKQRVTADDVEERCGGHEKFLELEQRWKDWIRDLPYDYDPRAK